MNRARSFLEPGRGTLTEPGDDDLPHRPAAGASGCWFTPSRPDNQKVRLAYARDLPTHWQRGSWHEARLLRNERISPVSLTGATASLRGSANFACLAVGKFGLRALAQSMARELGPRGIHVAHVIIDGQIDPPGLRAMAPERESETLLSPDAVAETYWQLHVQAPTSWTLELDLRLSVERF